MEASTAGTALAPADPRLTDEDLARSRDRSRVNLARELGRRRYLILLLVGPGILAMLGENDGPSMISYAADGASYGYGFFLPFIVVLFAMAYVCQEMCIRAGAVTHRGFGGLVLQRFGPVWGWFGAGDLVFTNLVTLVSESSRSASGWPTSTSAPGSQSPWDSCWWRSRSVVVATGAGSASCSGWRCSMACSWPRRSWSSPTSARSGTRSRPSLRFPAGASTRCCC